MDNWIHSAVIYQVNLRSLAAREPRNAIEAANEVTDDESPLAYVTRNLRTLLPLGVNTLYLLPPYPIGMHARKGIGSPYSIRDFRAVEPEYGTDEQLKQFVREAHGLGFRVIFDITPNHTSRDNVWTKEHPEFYVRNDDGSLYYDWDWSDTAKLDYRRPALRAAMIEVYDFWLSFLGEGDGIDGFRLDMAHFINDLSFWDEAMPRLRARHADRQLLFMAESYGSRNNLDLFARGINAAYDDDLLKVATYLYAIGAGGDTCIDLSPAAERNDDFHDILAACRTGGIAGAVESVLAVYEERYPSAGEQGPWLARYTDNHDEGRGVYRFGVGGTRAMNRLLFLCPRTLPFLLTGQEFGAVNRPSIHDRLGFCDKGYDRLGDRGRVSVPGVEFEGNLFARGRELRRDWYEFYRQLVRLRAETPELSTGTFALIDVKEDAAPTQRTVIAFERRLGSDCVRCAVNLGADARTLGEARQFGGLTLYGGLEDGQLPAFGAVVVRV